jgi:hypothetical protein
MMQVPSWIQPADEAGEMARGLQIGTQIGAQQADQQFRAMQMARQQQLAAQEQARWEAEFGLQSKVAAEKFSAMQEYKQRVQKGEDPMQVLMEIGPRIGGQGAVEAAVVRAQQAQQAAQLKAQTALAQRVIQPPQPFDQGGMRGFMVQNRWGETVPHFAPREPATPKTTWPDEDIIQLRNANAEIGHIRRQMMSPQFDTPEAKADFQQQLQDQQDIIKSLYEKHPESKLPQAPVRVLPWPARKQDAIKGRFYQTPKGVLMFNGEKFVEPPRAPESEGGDYDPEADQQPQTAQATPAPQPQAQPLATAGQQMLGPQIPRPGWLQQAAGALASTPIGRIFGDQFPAQ